VKILFRNHDKPLGKGGRYGTPDHKAGPVVAFTGIRD
jgi:hypothetical protein